MRQATLYFFVVCFASCRNEQIRLGAYGNKMCEQMTAEIEVERNLATEKTMAFSKDTRNNDVYRERLTTTLAISHRLFENVQETGLAKASLDSLESFFLEDINRYGSFGHKKYSISLHPYNLEKANPQDTAICNQLHSLFEQMHENTLTFMFRNALLNMAYSRYMDCIRGYASPLGCDFRRIDFLVVEPQNIWYQNEDAFVVPTISQFNQADPNPVRVNGKEYKTPVTLKAPSQKGVHEISGEVGIKERGEMVWIPFIHRILVE